MVTLTETAVGKVKEILGAQEPKPAGLRISVVGGGCSGFSYSMAFENTPGFLDKTYKFDELNVRAETGLGAVVAPGLTLTGGGGRRRTAAAATTTIPRL